MEGQEILEKGEKSDRDVAISKHPSIYGSSRPASSCARQGYGAKAAEYRCTPPRQGKVGWRLATLRTVQDRKTAPSPFSPFPLSQGGKATTTQCGIELPNLMEAKCSAVRRMGWLPLLQFPEAIHQKPERGGGSVLKTFEQERGESETSSASPRRCCSLSPSKTSQGSGVQLSQRGQSIKHQARSRRWRLRLVNGRCYCICTGHRWHEFPSCFRSFSSSGLGPD